MLSISSSDMPILQKGIFLILCSIVFAALEIIILNFGARKDVYMGVEVGRVLLLATGAYFVAHSCQKRFGSVLWLGIWILCNGIEIEFMGMISFLMINRTIVNVSFGRLVIFLGIDVILVFLGLNRLFPRRIP